MSAWKPKHFGILLLILMCYLITADWTSAEDSGVQGNGTPLHERMLTRSRYEMIAVRIRASFADRKDIRSRYIRVRFDGQTVQLAGFVKDAAQAATAEAIARKIAPGASIIGFWQFESDLDEREAYMTRIAEQAADAEIWARIQVTLRSPAIRPILADADIQAVDVRHGKVRLFVIAESERGIIDLTPYLSSTAGVAEVSQSTVKAYATAIMETVVP